MPKRKISKTKTKPKTKAKGFKRGRSSPRLRVLSFFSGAMGLDLGLESEGLETLLACEVDRRCRETIGLNRPNLPVLGDIREYDAKRVRSAAGLGAREPVDVMVGGPPCQAFSTAGKRLGLQDDRGNVFLHFIDLIGTVRPRYAVLENVRGLLSAPLAHRPHQLRGDGYPPLTQDELPGGALAFILTRLESYGYSVSFNLYNAANFGAPQSRERVILFCHRGAGRIPYILPTHSQSGENGLPRWRTFRDAVAGLDGPHEHVKFSERRLGYYRMLGPGQYWRHLPEALQREALGASFHAGGGKTGFFRRLAWDKPSPTLVTHPAMPATDLCHPEEDRPLSVEEYKAIQGIPATWQLAGKTVDKYRMLGNAVPVALGAAVARTLIAHAGGKVQQPPLEFAYSRYVGTDDRTWRATFSNQRLDAGRCIQQRLFA